MGKDKKFVQEITDMEKDFAQWYTDVVKKAELIDYSSVRGCMILQPYGYAIWELIQQQLDKRFKETGHKNVYMPMFIPESLLQKEKDHVEGFAPEVAWVTHGGSEQLTERLCVRPTSETLFCEHYANVIQSYRDLPKLYNQWCSVVRWEKTTRPFLRTLEFLWQEGHTAHATAEEAQEETIRMLNVYAEFCENVLAIPVVKGRKTDKEKFAGAKETYTIESLMHDGKALQSGTSHNFGDGFARAFGIQYTDKNNELKYVHQTSWGMTTRLIGAVIMVHGDNSGLVLPPRIAPTQLVIIPIAAHKEGVLEKARELKERLSAIVRVDLDDSDKMPGWKFSEYEMKGVPFRLEIGPKDIENNQVVLVRRDTREKITVSMDELETRIPELMDSLQRDLLEKARAMRDTKTYVARTFDEFKEIITNTPGFIKAMWCGDEACEIKIKEETGATSRCIPFEQEKISDTCVCCGKPAKDMLYWGKAY
ncbi:MAG: prolyl-tRNA synthetase [Epulopiscium sp.]|uniref:Proline--tRNA ligase n=1 Tax=Defluviitalea raffinosedens TaxID=1450156 RepID=A0A7C8HFL3_9FIRM|nr:proline--tRNA ligase [Defluviitalea raffinosedens]MBZ4667768.1 proline--tRNA ligase [Defluviitaleaceae bacterium]MDK2787802.1 prolyl-tRNA synthetase [Candidatus Epulonipiscium sp.]KAE9636063.1 proline--tRNA ligase [Defluviitalea raffinosedens]MBM7685092.1 prolyl-tRNA synthetase [Defluviitalea raffinosedens]HHW67444.1 proline--tRNA ligase [Candidatus Epulonipiscium sp.]